MGDFMLRDKDLVLRPIEAGDLERFWELVFKEAWPEWKEWDAPYFSHEQKSYEEFLKGASSWVNHPRFWAVVVDDKFVGTVSYYWEDEGKYWLEMGIVLYESNNWNRGLGYRAMRLWMDYLFENLDVARVGFTTWSGNARMMRVGEKLGMTLEARLRKVRFYNGEYYDSIRMGILREEWAQG